MAERAVAPRKQEIGAPVDDFILTGLNGSRRSLQSYLEGKQGAVVVFWSGVCSHCVRYDGYLNAFSQRHPELGLVAIASRYGESPQQILDTFAERQLAFPLLLDPDARIARQWHTQQTPRAFLVDHRRTLLYRGAIDNFKSPQDPEYRPYLEPAITQFLAGEPLSRTETASFGCAVSSVFYLLPPTIGAR